MKLWSSDHTFSYPWKKVTEAAWRKYPNEHNTNVTAIDVVDRKVTDDGKLLTTRIFGSNWNLPTFITTLLGMPESCYAVEHSEVDMKNEKMTLKMINYTFWGMLAVEETLVYQPHALDSNKTSLTQGAKISVNGIQFSNYFEEVICSNFEATSKKGRKALQQVLSKIEVERIINSVSEELRELSSDIDKATTKLDFHISHKLQSLSDQLEKATSVMNSEIHVFSDKLTAEFSNLIGTLDKELDQITVKIKTSSDNENKFSNIGLAAAVKQSGISAAFTSESS